MVDRNGENPTAKFENLLLIISNEAFGISDNWQYNVDCVKPVACYDRFRASAFCQ